MLKQVISDFTNLLYEHKLDVSTKTSFGKTYERATFRTQTYNKTYTYEYLITHFVPRNMFTITINKILEEEQYVFVTQIVTNKFNITDILVMLSDGFASMFVEE